MTNNALRLHGVDCTWHPDTLSEPVSPGCCEEVDYGPAALCIECGLVSARPGEVVCVDCDEAP